MTTRLLSSSLHKPRPDANGGYLASLSGWRWELLFEPRDLWVGLYWKHLQRVVWDFYICPLPTLVLHVRWIR